MGNELKTLTDSVPRKSPFSTKNFPFSTKKESLQYQEFLLRNGTLEMLEVNFIAKVRERC